MCEVHENENDIPEYRFKAITSKWQECKKCGGTNGPPCMAIRSDEPPSCKTCFIQSCTHKFRTSFGKSQLLRKGERVLVAFSGGHCSVALLHLICEALKENEHRRLRFSPIFIHINESALYGSDSSENEIKYLLESTSHPFEMVDLEECCNNATVGPAGEDPREALRSMLRAVKCPSPESSTLGGSSREERRVTLLHWVLANASGRLGVKFVFLGDCCSRLSQRMFTHVVSGRGDQCSTALALCDTRFPHSTFVRPLREFSVKELALLNHYCGRAVVVQRNWETGSAPESSVERLTEHFLTSLQTDFPSTIFTVFRTGTKLTRGRADSSSQVCRLCQNPYVTAPEDENEPCAWNALRQTYRLLGKKWNDLDSCLCYSCQISLDK